MYKITFGNAHYDAVVESKIENLEKAIDQAKHLAANFDHCDDIPKFENDDYEICSYNVCLDNDNDELIEFFNVQEKFNTCRICNGPCEEIYDICMNCQYDKENHCE